MDLRVDDVIARIAALQHGRVARTQLLHAGVGRGAIAGRLARGQLRQVHYGVYAVGHEAPSLHARWTAGVLAVDGRVGVAQGVRAALSHQCAAMLWCGLEPGAGLVHVTCPDKRRRQSGIVLHRAALPVDEVRIHDLIIVTSPARTTLDLAAGFHSHRLERLVRDLEFRRRVTYAELEEILDRYPRRRGRQRLAAIVARASGERGRTKSGPEDRVRRFVRTLPLPAPEANAVLPTHGRSYEVDLYWPEVRLAVEIDSVAAHQTAFSYEEDRRRDRALGAVGVHVIRVTEDAFLRDRAAVGREIVATWNGRKDGSYGTAVMPKLPSFGPAASPGAPSAPRAAS